MKQARDRVQRYVSFLIADAERRAYARGFRPGGDLCLPDFLGIGAQKAGTTWLHANLSRHPDLFLAEPKEVHYFNKSYHRRLAHYARHFEPGRGKVVGEITPAYQLLSPRRIRLIRGICPDLRLIFLMRNPIDRAWSHAMMDLVKTRGRRVEEVPDREFVDHFRSQPSLRRGTYSTAIDRWTTVFGDDRLLIRTYEDISNHPRKLLGDVFDHLGVARDVDWARFPIGEVVFEGLKHGIPERHFRLLSELYGGEIRVLADRFGDAVACWRTGLEAG